MNDTKQVAKDLLGKILVRKIGNKILSGVITETEAYKGKNDPASHASRKKTERNKIMFGEVGVAYVYFTYGMHYCFNVVAKKNNDKAGAILIRAIQPQQGINHMKKNRKINNISNLTNGPGAEISALIADRFFELLDGPVRRVAAKDSPVPFNWFLEEKILPQTEDVSIAIQELLEY